METTIIDEPNEKLVVKPGDNDTVVMIHKRREGITDYWAIKTTILNRREALLMNRAISQIMLEPAPIYEVIRSTITIQKGGE